MKLTVKDSDGFVLNCTGDEAIEKIRALWADVDRKLKNSISPIDGYSCSLVIEDLDADPGDRFAWDGINLLRGEYGHRYGYDVKIVNK